MRYTYPIRILVIDDDPAEGEILRALLGAEGHTVVVAPTGDVGLLQAQANPPDLVLLDVMMPGMDGYAVCMQLRAHPRTAEVPIIFLTALGDRTSRLRGIEHGADEYLSKPIDETELRLRVRTIAQVNRFRRLLDERERTIAALRKARDAALEASRLKSSFVATVSHELRTPLVGVLGMAELLLDTTLDEDQRELTQTVLRSGRSLLAVINDILEYTSLEAGTYKLHAEPFNLAAVFAHIIGEQRISAEAKGLALDSIIDGRVSAVVIGDYERLQHVLRQLIGNAIKFTEGGAVRVTAQIVAETAAELTLLVEVRDTGPGVPEALQEQLFQPFQQLDGSDTRPYDGLGLGLAICSRIVGLMGGSIGVRAHDGPGATFWFQTPLRIDNGDQLHRE